MTQAELLASMMEEHYEHARAHEEHRASAANFVLATCGLLLGFAVQATEVAMATTMAVLVMLLSCYGLLFCRKHYERFKFHVAVAVKVRKTIEAHNKKDQASDNTLGDFDSLRAAVEEEYFKDPIQPSSQRPGPGASLWVKGLRLYKFYDMVHILMALAAVCVAFLKWWPSIKAISKQLGLG